MVVPLKLTQFYGHSVPRPRIYAVVKFSEHRVDPPPSVNDALLSWASDAHWSMGGLSFKRLRTQGKVEGSVRRLRSFVEEEEDAPDGSEKVKAMARREAASKPVENVEKVKSTATKGASKPAEKKRQRSEIESVEATPARKLRKREILEESSEEGSPAFVPATEEKLQKKGRGRVESAEVVRKKGSRSPSNTDVLVAETPSSVSATGERRRGKLFTASGKSLRGSKSPASNVNLATEASPASEAGRLTRSGKKAFREDASVSPLLPSKGRPRARKILIRGSDEESSESDDGLEAFLKEQGRPLRRSSRLVKEEQGNSSLNSSASDSDSE